MLVNGQPYRTIWLKPDDPAVVRIIDQRRLPHEFRIGELRTLDDACRAISDMAVRGAGLIGATAAFGIYLAAIEGHDLDAAAAQLVATRPTAANLAWAVRRQLEAARRCATRTERQAATLAMARRIADEDAAACKAIGEHGLALIREIARRKNGGLVRILTHCNAGWLAFVDYGSATAPIYAAQADGISLHVWVDETRPRNQGAALTAWELCGQGVPHDLICDNAGGHLMQHGLVDLVIVGADRVTRRGDAANKIGTYLKALAAHDNHVPFYVALPSSTFDLSMADGIAEIPIEERDATEVRFVAGKTGDGAVTEVQICPDATAARNWGFDVTPARLVTGLICEHGIYAATAAAIKTIPGNDGICP